MSKAVLAHIASRVLNVPLMVTPEKLDVILHALGPRIGLGDFSLERPPQAVTDFSSSPRYREYTGDGIGLIPVMGLLAYNVSFEDALCGDVTSYHEIRQMFREALNDPLVTSILFAFDSPGGEVAGVFDLTDEIYRARDKKPIYAVIDESAFSAAYALASASSTIFIPRTGGVGSIGIIAHHIDQSAKDAKEGLKITPVLAGARKNDFSPHQPLPPEGLARLQALVDENYKLFVDTVARNRGLSVDAVRNTEAATFHGEGAVRAGFADRISNFHEAVRYIESQTRGGQTMKIFGRKATVVPAAVDTESSRTDKEPEEVVDLQAVIEQARAEGRAEALKEMDAESVRTAEVARIAAIRDKSAAVAGLLPAGFADHLIREGVSAEAAGGRIIQAIADKSRQDAPEVTSTVTPTGAGGPNPLVADAQRRADAAAKRKER